MPIVGEGSTESLSSEGRVQVWLPSGVGAFDWDLTHRRLVLSPGLEEMLGFEPNGFSGSYEDFARVIHSEDLPLFETELARCVSEQDSFAFIFRILRSQGQHQWVEWRGDLGFEAEHGATRLRGIALKADSGEGLAPELSHAPTTQGREAELGRLVPLYQALNNIHQAIVCTSTRQDLFEKVCQALVEQGGIRTVWIGIRLPHANELTPVGKFGDDGGYVETIKISVQDVPEGRGPSGTAFRENRPVICNDTFTDPAIAPWRANMKKHGFRACASFPIRESGKVSGTLNVYAATAGGFKEREIALLVEAANRTSFALDSLAQDERRRQAETELRRELDFSDALLESLPGIIYLYDQERRFLRWNKNLERVSGYSAEEIQGMSPLDFQPPGERSLVANRIDQVFQQGQSSVEANFWCKDGTSLPYHFTGVRARLDGVDCLVGIGIDISERKRAEEARLASEARYQTLFEYAPEGILIGDSESNYTDANPSICRMLGYTREEMVGLHASDILVFDDERQIGDALDIIKSRSNYHREWLFRRKDGSRFPAEVRATLMPDGSLLGMVRDITERKEAEVALRDLNENLEVKVADRTEELRTALVRAEAADRIKSAFLATMSHELRTPLNSIIGFTGIILQGLAGPLTPEQTKQLSMVKSSSRHLLELINDVLDLSKIEAGQLEVRNHSFDLSASIDKVLASIRPQVENKGLRLTAVVTSDLGEVVSDRRRVEQILLNLISNALKFTESGSIHFEAEIAADAGPVPIVRLSVSDTGIGIKPEDLSTLFQPFRQLDMGLTRRHEGTGLGLVICARLAALLGGEIFVASQWSEGSQFTLILPLHRGVGS